MTSFCAAASIVQGFVEMVLQEHGIVYVVGKTEPRSPDKVGMLKKYLVHEPFLFLVHNFTSDADKAFGIPTDKVAIMGLPFQLS